MTAPTTLHSTQSVATRALRAFIRVYQAARAGRSPVCRFVPSCSDYALEALENFGARRGLALTARRLARCRPGGPFGLDPVPSASVGLEEPAP
jgi:putative membrane protein insertion efficiency factor